jgi:two-component sensor histidine kinase
VQSIAQQTLRNSEDLAGFEKHFMARIHSLAQAHSLLIRSDWRGASLEEVLRTELAPFQEGDRRCLLGGPHVGITPGAAMTMALIFHELATNAAKYGAFRQDDGRVAIEWDWTMDGAAEEPRLKICWTERNGPIVTPPTRQGFGSRLISQISRSMQGHAQIDYRRDGLSCTIDLPGSQVLTPERAAYRSVLDNFRQRYSPAAC